MDSKRFCGVAVATLTFVVAVAALGWPALAQQPEPVWRYFALVGLNQWNPPPSPDLMAPESKLLVMQSHAQAIPVVSFGFDSPSHADEYWYEGGEAAHVTSQGVEKYRLLWLGWPPPSGAIAWTGPDGAAWFDPTPIYVRPASGSEAGYDGSKFWVDDLRYGVPSTATVWYFGVGWFSK